MTTERLRKVALSMIAGGVGLLTASALFESFSVNPQEPSARLISRFGVGLGVDLSGASTLVTVPCSIVQTDPGRGFDGMFLEGRGSAVVALPISHLNRKEYPRADNLRAYVVDISECRYPMS